MNDSLETHVYEKKWKKNINIIYMYNNHDIIRDRNQVIIINNIFHVINYGSHIKYDFIIIKLIMLSNSKKVDMFFCSVNNMEIYIKLLLYATKYLKRSIYKKCFVILKRS